MNNYMRELIGFLEIKHGAEQLQIVRNGLRRAILFFIRSSLDTSMELNAERKISWIHSDLIIDILTYSSVKPEYLNGLIKIIFELSILGVVERDDEPETINDRIRILLVDFIETEEGKNYIDG